MSCRRAYELDLPAFVIDPRDPAWDDFRAHYPRCPECAPEVAAWSTLQAALAERHPEPAELLRWSDGALDQAARPALERHLAHCASCRDELRALDRFAAAPLASAETTTEPSAAEAHPTHLPSASRPGGRHGERHAFARPSSGRAAEHGAARSAARGGVRRVLWHPAFAYALVALVLLLPAVRTALDRDAGRAAFDQVAVGSPQQAPPAPVAARAPESAVAPAPAAAPAPDEAEKRPAAPAVRDDRATGALREQDRNTERDAQTEALNDAHVDRTAPRLMRQAPARPAAPPASDGSSAAPPPPATVPGAAAPAARRAESADDLAGGAAGEAARADRAPERRAQEAGAAGAPGEPAVASARLRTLGKTLERSTAVRLVPAAAGSAPTIAITLPDRLAAAGEVEVRVRDEQGGRELRQRIARPAGAGGDVTLALPAGFTAPRLAVEVYVDGVGPVVQGIVTP